MTITSIRTENPKPQTDWRSAAACRNEDPDLFFPEKNTPQADIDKAKAICGRCPVRQECLNEAFRADDRFSISGGLTAEERDRTLVPQQLSRFQSHRASQRHAREIAMSRGADMLVWLVKRKMHVGDVAERLGTSPSGVFHAWLMLVPASESRSTVQSSVQRVIAESSLTLRTLERSGRSHDQIAKTLGTSQNVVSACLRVLAQRDKALDKLSSRGIGDAVRMCQAEETRIRRESRSGLTVQDVIEMAGHKIVRMHRVDDIPLRHVAADLGMNRETVRKAYKEMTQSSQRAGMGKNEMERAA